MRKVIRRRIRHDQDGVQISGDVQVVIATNIGEDDADAEATSTQRTSIVQSSNAGVSSRRTKKKKPPRNTEQDRSEGGR
jgi:hypothetical protein